MKQAVRDRALLAPLDSARTVSGVPIRAGLNPESTKMTSIWREYTVREQDVEHIERLQELREAGDEMETSEELEASLLARFGDPEATETFVWATEDKIPLYVSEIWDRDGVLDGDFPKTVSENSQL